MPFPPAFTTVWDLTQPPDTQLLNQGALDFRTLKTDIMQRMSLLSGTLVNRPTPETVNATWGGTGFGLLYFATDTNAIYQWNGSAWVGVMGFPSVGGTILAPSGPATPVVWRAPHACTVTNVRGFRDGGTGATVNALNQGAALLASNLSLTSNDLWMDGGAVQNTAVAAGNSLQLNFASFTGGPNYVSIQIDLTRP